MTFTLVSIGWDGMKYVLQKDLSALSTFPLLSSAQALRLPACSARSLRPPSRPLALEASVLPLARPILLNVSPPRGTLRSALCSLLASRLAQPLVGALRASQPWCA